MKIAIFCNHGNVRSRALKYLIWRLNGRCTDTTQEGIENYTKYEAVALGAHSTTLETKKTFIDWADKVIDLSDNDQNIQPLLKELAKEKYIRFDIGPDIWHDPINPDLISKLKPLVKEIK